MRIGSAEIGDEVEGVEVAEIDVEVEGGAGTFLQLWRDGEKLAQVEVRSDALSHRFEDRPGAAERRYRVELVNAGNQRLVVTSHIYVRGVAGGGCGCRSDGGTAGLVGIGLVGLMMRRRRRR
jgi:MYXO-CTERM domain-containing protein